MKIIVKDMNRQIAQNSVDLQTKEFNKQFKSVEYQGAFPISSKGTVFITVGLGFSSVRLVKTKDIHNIFEGFKELLRARFPNQTDWKNSTIIYRRTPEVYMETDMEKYKEGAFRVTARIAIED